MVSPSILTWLMSTGVAVSSTRWPARTTVMAMGWPGRAAMCLRTVSQLSAATPSMASTLSPTRRPASWAGLGPPPSKARTPPMVVPMVGTPTKALTVKKSRKAMMKCIVEPATATDRRRPKD